MLPVGDMGGAIGSISHLHLYPLQGSQIMVRPCW